MASKEQKEQRAKQYAPALNIFTRLEYEYADDLLAVLQEIKRNVDEALDTTVRFKQKGTEVNAVRPEVTTTEDGIDNLRCIVEDAEEKLRPHWKALEAAWEAQAGKRQKALGARKSAMR